MEGRRREGDVIVDGDARQRFHDARGYGCPGTDGELLLDPIEAAHLLYRGDLDAVDGMDFVEYFDSIAGAAVGPRFLVYANLRSRGFYLAPARDGWVDGPPSDTDFVVFERGAPPRGGETAYRVRAIGERTSISAGSLGGVTLAVADEEGSVTYFGTDDRGIHGSTADDPPATDGRLLSDRVLVSDPPAGLYGSCFYGQPLTDRGEATVLQLSLLEAASLVRRGVLSLPADRAAILDRGRDLEGDRFDRRLAVYEQLRADGVVPKTGFKFGADFRTYAEVTDVQELGHSEALVWVLPEGYEFEPRELGLYVRLATGVRKRATFALVDSADTITWRSVDRLTP